VLEIRLDCDEDVILLTVEQAGGIACHTGRHHCFYRVLKGGEWVTVEEASMERSGIEVFSPETMQHLARWPGSGL